MTPEAILHPSDADCARFVRIVPTGNHPGTHYWELPAEPTLAWLDARTRPNVFRAEQYARAAAHLRTALVGPPPAILEAHQLPTDLGELLESVGAVALFCATCERRHERPRLGIFHTEDFGYEPDPANPLAALLLVELLGNAGLTQLFCPEGHELETYQRWTA